MNPTEENKQHTPDVPANWSAWAKSLQLSGLGSLLGAVLEAGGSLNTLLAQLVYIGSPLASTWMADEQLLEIAALLESPTESRRFAALLRENA